MPINGQKSKEEIYTYLQSLYIAVLATATHSGVPYAATIYFITDQELNFYFLTKSDTKKSRNLEKNNHAALTVIDASSPRTIQATGKVTEVEDPTQYRQMLIRISEANAKKGGFYWPPPLSKINSEGDLVLYKFTPEWLRFADFSEETSDYIYYDVIEKK